MNNANTFAQNAVSLIQKEQERLNKAIQLVVGQICETKLLNQKEKEKHLLNINNQIKAAADENKILYKEIETSVFLLESEPLVVPQIEKGLPVENKFKNIFQGIKEERIELEKADKQEEE